MEKTLTIREELYKQFGPMLIEAVILIIKDEINLLREQHGLPEKTNEQLMTAIGTKLETLDMYDWMTETI